MAKIVKLRLGKNQAEEVIRFLKMAESPVVAKVCNEIENAFPERIDPFVQAATAVSDKYFENEEVLKEARAIRELYDKKVRAIYDEQRKEQDEFSRATQAKANEELIAIGSPYRCDYWGRVIPLAVYEKEEQEKKAKETGASKAFKARTRRHKI